MAKVSEFCAWKVSLLTYGSKAFPTRGWYFSLKSSLRFDTRCGALFLQIMKITPAHICLKVFKIFSTIF